MLSGSLITAHVPSRCEITSREYCDFMMGYFHEEATLCSQVSDPLFISLLYKHSCFCCVSCLMSNSECYFNSSDSSSIDCVGVSSCFCAPSFRCTAWMTCVACCLSSTPRSQISFTGSGCHSSCTLGESEAARTLTIASSCILKAKTFLR